MHENGSGPVTIEAERRLEDQLRRALGSSPVMPFAVELPSGRTITIGESPPRFRCAVRNGRGLSAVTSLDELEVAEAYMNGDIDIDGSMRDVLYLRELFEDQNLWVSAWRRIEPIVRGRRESNTKWVQNHYDADHIQLYYVDRDYNTYTPGVFEREDEPLEVASERKHRLAFEGLGLKAGDRILEVGFGWGSFLRYATRRGVHVTGLTLSRHQLAWVSENLVAKEGLPADLVYGDFFDYEPEEKFDGIVMVGVIEELADFQGVMRRIWRWLKPGKRVYIDFMAATRDFVFPSFVSKYIYQGGTCRVYLPKFVDAATRSPFEIVGIHNDRRNYYLTAKHWYDRYEESAALVRERYGERTYRMFRMYLAGAAHMLDHPSHLTTAFRVFLELPTDHLALRGQRGPVAFIKEARRGGPLPRVLSALQDLSATLPEPVVGVAKNLAGLASVFKRSETNEKRSETTETR
jgi:cyclopropane-fatty-acyl-phospholipid synthase